MVTSCFCWRVRVRLSEAYYEEKMSEQQSEIDRLLVERQKLQELQRQLSRVYSNMPSNTVRMRVYDLIQRRFTLLTTYTENSIYDHPPAATNPSLRPVFLSRLTGMFYRATPCYGQLSITARADQTLEWSY